MGGATTDGTRRADLARQYQDILDVPSPTTGLYRLHGLVRSTPSDCRRTLDPPFCSSGPYGL